MTLSMLKFYSCTVELAGVSGGLIIIAKQAGVYLLVLITNSV